MPERASDNRRHRHPLLAALLALLPLAAAAQEPAALEASAPALGAHTLLTHSEGEGVTPAVTAPMDTQPSGSSFIVLNGGYAKNANAPDDSYANRWKRIGRSVSYNGYGDAFNVTAYVALAGKGGAGHTVRVDKSGYPEGEISLPFIEVTHAGVLQDVAQNYAEPGLVLSSGSVTTTGPALLVAVWWGDGAFKHMTTRPDSGFTLLDSYLMLPDNSGVQCAVAYKRVDAAGTYNVRWIGSPIQGAILWLFAFQARPADTH
ncbi:hypothetical protein [Dyella sp. C9]|uniref:hypothetical protein n=1 Tax=Dyella sp. C9 TaxID=2202154 RepID=UPI000DEFF48F|nr:hypothetical protein [Dyella sp. C9]